MDECFFCSGSNLVENLSVTEISSCPGLVSHWPPTGGRGSKQYGKHQMKFTKKYLCMKQTKKSSFQSYSMPQFTNLSNTANGKRIEKYINQILIYLSFNFLKKTQGRGHLWAVIFHRCHFNNGIQKGEEGVTIMRDRSRNASKKVLEGGRGPTTCKMH